MELYDRFSETVLDEWEVDLSEIDEDGEYHLPIPDIFSYWSSHPELYGEEMDNFPIPVLRTAYVYTDDDVVLSANSAWLMLHTRKRGHYVVRLPRRVKTVLDVTVGDVVARDCDNFTCELEKFQTAVFLLAD